MSKHRRGYKAFWLAVSTPFVLVIIAAGVSARNWWIVIGAVLMTVMCGLLDWIQVAIDREYAKHETIEQIHAHRAGPTEDKECDMHRKGDF